jgi:hypothetical protein
MYLNLAILLLLYCLLRILVFSCSQMVLNLLAPILPDSVPILPAQSKLVSLDLMLLLYTSLKYHPPLSYIFFPSAVETQFTPVLYKSYRFQIYKTMLRLIDLEIYKTTWCLIDAKSLRRIWGL